MDSTLVDLVLGVMTVLPLLGLVVAGAIVLRRSLLTWRGGRASPEDSTRTTPGSSLTTNEAPIAVCHREEGRSKKEESEAVDVPGEICAPVRVVNGRPGDEALWPETKDDGEGGNWSATESENHGEKGDSGTTWEMLDTQMHEGQNCLPETGQKQTDLKETTNESMKNPDGPSTFVVQMNVRKEMHAHLIGRNGRNKMQLQRDHAVKVNVPARLDDSETVTICGAKENVLRVESVIREMVDAVSRRSVEFLEVSPKQFGHVVGKKGRTVHLLEEEFQVRICVPRKGRRVSMDHQDAANKIRVTGHPDDVAKAVEKIRHITDIVEETLAIKPEYLRAIIGEKGNNLKWLREQFGVKVTVPAETKSLGDKVNVTITGHRQRVAGAKSEILRVTDEHGEEDKSWHAFELTTSQADELFLKDTYSELKNYIEAEFNIKVSSLTNKEDQRFCVIEGATTNDAQILFNELLSDTESSLLPEGAFEVPKKYHGLVVGQGGKVLREIQKTCQVRLIVPKPNDQKDYVTILGLAENVEDAKHMISGIIQRWSAVWNEGLDE